MDDGIGRVEYLCSFFRIRIVRVLVVLWLERRWYCVWIPIFFEYAFGRQPRVRVVRTEFFHRRPIPDTIPLRRSIPPFEGICIDEPWRSVVPDWWTWSTVGAHLNSSESCGGAVRIVPSLGMLLLYWMIFVMTWMCAISLLWFDVLPTEWIVIAIFPLWYH